MKLAVGAADVADLRAWQERRAVEAPPLRHLTRQTPRRTEEILAGGSLFWVIQGLMQVRQRILAITADTKEGTPCAALVLDPALVAVEPRPVRPFQGWRYLEAGRAPPDSSGADSGGLDQLPPRVLHELRELCLI